MHSTKQALLSCALALFASSAAFAYAPQQTVIDESFDSFFLFNDNLARSLNAHEFADIVYNEGIADSKALKVYYQGNDRGSARIVEPFLLSETGSLGRLSFDVKFCEGFDFARGGKLHGFGPVNTITGGQPIETDGWSARAMWGRDGSLKSYIYHQNMKGRYGDGVKAEGFRFQPGRFHHVEYRLRVNEPAAASNGQFDIYVDGRQVLSHQGLRLRASKGKDTLINKFLFSTFHGGSSPDWAPRNASGRYKRDCAVFDNIRVQIN